jgi:transcriptional regulator with XRE-family HTH domain
MEWKTDEIKALRQDLGLTQAKFADRLYVKRQTVACWESFIKIPSRKNQSKLSKLAGETVSKESVAQVVNQDRLVGYSTVPT